MTIIDNETIDLQTRRGPVRTYLYRPAADGKYPGLVFFSEILQVTGPIRGNADTIDKELSSYDEDARVVLDQLKSHPRCTGKLGAIGICIGGHLSFRAAMNPEVLAAVSFYATDIHKRSLGKGMKDNSLDRIKEIKGELLMIWGRQDPHVPLEGRKIVYDALCQAGTNFTWHEFNGAHAFLRDEGYRYDPALARLGYDLTLELFHRKLGEGDRSEERRVGIES